MGAELVWMIAGIAAVGGLWLLLSLKSKRSGQDDESYGRFNAEEPPSPVEEQGAFASKERLD